MKKQQSKLILISIVVLFLLSGYCSAQKTISERTYQHIHFLADDSLKGRKPGTPECLTAARYIRDNFKSYGLQLLADNGFQYFNVVTEVNIGDNNSLSINGNDLKINEDFTPLSFSGNGKLEAEAFFVGYGFDLKKDSLIWNDYKDLDVKGKWVVILRGDPDPDNRNSLFIPFSDERDKVLTAADKGASGVIFVSGVKVNDKDELESIYYDKSESGAGIPVIQITRAKANLLLEDQNQTIENLENKIITSHQPYSFIIPKIIKGETEVIPNRVRTQNVIAMIPGTDKTLQNEVIVVGAHYDHLGMGGPGSGSRVPDTIAVHNGADDNASGVAGILELARLLSQKKGGIKRSIVFISFSAEELGLIGSKYFVDHPLPQGKKIVAMINLDMIGRFNYQTQELTIGGTGTSKEALDILKDLGTVHHLNLLYSPDGYGPSDHASFYTKDIPVFFITTGANEDYHTPADDADKINYPGTERIVKFLYDLVLNVADRPQDLTFQEAGPKGRSKYGYRFKVTLGIMPGFGESETPGLRVDGVHEGGPAFNGGMEKGDIIVAINGKPISNIYDYMFWLKKLEPGQTITVDVIRDNKKKVLLIQL